MIKIVASLLVVLLFSGMCSVRAQDAAFTQFYANPLFLNPALTGNTECGRIHTNYRNQWPSLGKAYTTYSVTYDQNLSAINSGFGFIAMNDQQGDGAFNRTLAGAFYSYKLQISRDAMLSFGMKAAFYQESINWSKLIFASDISGTGAETPPENPTIYTVDFSAGMVLGVRDEYFVGIAADHLSQPTLSFYDNENSFLPLKLSAHAGVNLNASTGLLGGGRESDLLIQPNLLFMQQGDFSQLNLGVYINKYPFVTGAWFRHTFNNMDAVVVLAGIKWEQFRFGYSYDFTVSKLGGRSGGAHEISLAWEFCVYTASKRTIRTIKSPSF
jgi:type IX secretion system PorP/SprF family membrane protein